MTEEDTMPMSPPIRGRCLKKLPCQHTCEKNRGSHICACFKMMRTGSRWCPTQCLKMLPCGHLCQVRLLRLRNAAKIAICNCQCYKCKAMQAEHNYAIPWIRKTEVKVKTPLAKVENLECGEEEVVVLEATDILDFEVKAWEAKHTDTGDTFGQGQASASAGNSQHDPTLVFYGLKCRPSVMRYHKSSKNRCAPVLQETQGVEVHMHHDNNFALQNVGEDDPLELKSGEIGNVTSHTAETRDQEMTVVQPLLETVEQEDLNNEEPDAKLKWRKKVESEFEQSLSINRNHSINHNQCRTLSEYYRNHHVKDELGLS